jgi:hypothetical protein
MAKTEQSRGCFEVDCAGEVRLLGTRGIANDCGQVSDRFDAVERGRQCLAIAYVGADEFEARMCDDIQQRITAEEQGVHAPNMVTLLEQLTSQNGADVASATCNQDSHD